MRCDKAKTSESNHKEDATESYEKHLQTSKRFHVQNFMQKNKRY